MTFKILIGLMLLCLAAFASTVSSDDAGDLAGRVADQYRNLGNYYAAGSFKLSTTVMGSSQDIEAPFIQAGKAPGRMRMEIQHDILGSLVVSDGEAMWTYFKATGQYKKVASVPIAGRGGEKPGATVMGPGGSFLGMYGTIDSEGISVRQAGFAEIEFAGVTVRCTVLKLVHAPSDSAPAVLGPDSLFVDPSSAFVLKSVHNVEGEVQGMAMKTRMVLEYDDIRMDTEPADELFVFVPPAGATEVEEFGGFGGTRVDLTGTMAPDFRLADLDGKPHRLENYRGKVVLLDFWASWCAPCRKELPSIEKFHREYRDKGLVILAINSETQNVARSFVKKNGYTFPVVRDAEGTVFDDYAVSSIPVTIVIDRTGRIVAHFVGFGGEEELVSALRSAGIE